ncbi:MAG: sensor histidine kinase [Neomegalonema sp.]
MTTSQPLASRFRAWLKNWFPTGDAETERDFAAWNATRTFQTQRLSLFLGVFVYSLFGILDAQIDSESTSMVLLIRFAIGAPLMLLIALSYRANRSPEDLELLVTIDVLIASLTIVWMMAIGTETVVETYPFGIVIVMAFASGFLVQNFRMAIPAQFFVIACFVGVYLVRMPDHYYMIANIMFVVTAYITLVFANIVLEKRARDSFFAIREAERARQRAIEMYEDAQEASYAKTQFLATVSHELRTPLNAIIGFSDIMSKEMLGPIGTPQYKEYAADTNHSGRHLLNIIENILDMSRFDLSKTKEAAEEVPLDEAVRTAVRMSDTYAKAKDVKIKVRTPRGPVPTVLVDETRFQQVLVNLIDNAVKFTPARGRVTVSWKLRESGAVAVSITDNGIGIPQDKIDRVLEPFTQVENAFSKTNEGLGLGLSLVRRILEAHGGASEIESRLGEGSTFYAVLPAARVRSDEPDNTPGPAEAASEPIPTG